jgi:hypothetical protein
MYDASGSSMRSMVNCRPVPPAAAPTAPASSAAQTSERSPGVPLLLMPLGAKRKTRLPSVYAVRVPGTSHYRRLRSFGAEQGQPTEGKKATVLGRGATRVHRLSTLLLLSCVIVMLHAVERKRATLPVRRRA